MADDLDNLENEELEEQDEKRNILDEAKDKKDKIDRVRDKVDKGKSEGVDKPEMPKSSPTTPGAPGGPGALPTTPGTPPVGVTGGATAGGTTAGAGAAAGGTTAGAGAAAGGAAATGGAAAGGAAAGVSGAAAAGAGASFFGVAAIVIVIAILIFLLVGIIVVIVYLPGTLIEKIKGFFKAIEVFIVGEDKALGDKDFALVANYIKDRGYDLYAEGYINVNFEEDDFDEDTGKIAKLPKQTGYYKDIPHLVELYTRMHKYTYRVRNNDAATLFANDDMAGFLYLHVAKFEDNTPVSEKDLGVGFFRKIAQVSEDNELLIIKRNLFGGKYNFYMDGWAGRYGLPLEFFMALHQGTRAPDLVREIARGTNVFEKTFDSDNKVVYSRIVDDYDPDDSEDLIYRKPILHILLLETKYKSAINFLIPENSTINGQVYVLKKDLKFDEEYNSNPFASLTEDDFEKKSSVTANELHKTFFKTPYGTFVRIKPKKPGNTKLTYFGQYMPRDSNGVIKVSPYKTVKKTEGERR